MTNPWSRQVDYGFGRCAAEFNKLRFCYSSWGMYLASSSTWICIIWLLYENSEISTPKDLFHALFTLIFFLPGRPFNSTPTLVDLKALLAFELSSDSPCAEVKYQGKSKQFHPEEISVAWNFRATPRGLCGIYLEGLVGTTYGWYGWHWLVSHHARKEPVRLAMDNFVLSWIATTWQSAKTPPNKARARQRVWGFCSSKDERNSRGAIMRTQEDSWLSFSRVMKWASDSAQIFSHCQAHLGHPVTDAVITVPAYFNDSQRSEYLETVDLGSGQIVPRHVAVSSSLWDCEIVAEAGLGVEVIDACFSCPAFIHFDPGMTSPKPRKGLCYRMTTSNNISRRIVTSDISQVFKMNFRINCVCMYYILQRYTHNIYIYMYTSSIYITHQLLITNKGNNSRWSHPLETRQATKDAGAICGLNVLRCHNLVSLGIIVFPNVYRFDNNESCESYMNHIWIVWILWILWIDVWFFDNWYRDRDFRSILLLK